jgi:hypothetical protein
MIPWLSGIAAELEGIRATGRFSNNESRSRRRGGYGLQIDTWAASTHLMEILSATTILPSDSRVARSVDG